MGPGQGRGLCDELPLRPSGRSRTAAAAGLLGLVHVRQVLGLPLLRRGADDQDDHLSVALVAQLLAGLGLDDGDRTGRELHSLGRVTNEERRRTFEDDEHLFLGVFDMAAASYAGRQAPDVGAHGVEGTRERCKTPSLVASLRHLELALVGSEDRVPHGGRLADPPPTVKSLVTTVADKVGIRGLQLSPLTESSCGLVRLHGALLVVARPLLQHSGPATRARGGPALGYGLVAIKSR
jgi:hypothetical protein